MNEFLNQLRKARPDYATATDFEVASAFADGNNLDRAAVFSALGLKEPTFFGELKNAIPRSLGQSVQGIGQIAEDAGWENNPVKRYGQSVIERNPTQINSLGDIADYPLAALGSGVGNAAGFLLPSGAVGLAGKAYGLGRLGMGTAQTLTAAVPSYGGIREQQIAEGHNEPKDILAAATGAGAVGWIEQRFGLNKMLGLSGAEKTSAREFASEMGKTPFRTGAKGALRTGLAEGAEEIAQNPIEQISAYQDPTSAKSIEDTLFSGAMGVLGGLGLGGYGGVRSALHHNQVVDLLNTGALHDPSMSGDIRNLAGEYRAGQIDATQGVEAGDQWLENYRRAVELDRDVGELQSYRLPEEIAVDAVRQATNEGENLPLQEVINLTAGVHKAEKADRKGSVFNGPSGVFASGPDGIERELTNGELLALRAGEDITQKPVKQSKTAEKKLSQSATNFEKIVRDDVGKGAIPGDHPLVIEWDASNKTAGDARRIGKKYSEAILSVQKPAAETATARSVVDKLTKKQREYFDAVEEVAGTGEVEHDAAIARKLGISRQAVNERKKNAISAVLREIKARYGLDDAQARGKVNEYFASLRTVEAADVDTFGLSPDMQNNTTIGMDEVFGNDGAPNQMSIVDSAGKTTENRFADTTGNREGAEGTAILSAAGMLDNGWVKPFDGQVVGMNKAEAARRFNVEVENTKRKKRNDATYAFTTLLDEKDGIEGELIQSIENEFGKESVDMATDEWNDYAHIQSRDGVSTPAFYELDIAQQRQAIKLLNTWLSKSPRTKMGLYDLFDRVEYDYYGRAYLGSALGGHASGGSRQIGGKTSEDAPRIGTGTGAKAITGEERANSSGAGEGTTKTRAGAEDQTDPAVETERQVPSADGGEEAAEVARQWNKLSAAYGIATWKGLAESQKGALLDAFATGDQARVESAVYAVVRQLNGEEVDTGDTAQFSRKTRGVESAKQYSNKHTDETREIEKAIRADLRKKGRSTATETGFIHAEAVPDAIASLVKAVEKLFGVRVKFVSVSDHAADIFNGLYLGGKTLVVNRNADNPYATVIGHEFLHYLRNSNKALYLQMRDALRAVAKAKSFNEATKKHMPSIDAEEEVFADTFGDHWSDPKFWQELANRTSASVFLRVKTAFVNFLNKLVNQLKALGSTGKTDGIYSDLNAVREAILKTTYESARQRKNAMPALNYIHARFSQMADATAPLWYSRAAVHVAQKGPGKAPASVWMSNLNSWAKSGAIKPEEIQWSGVENWLKGQKGTVSREALAQFFNEGGVQVEEKVLGEKINYDNPPLNETQRNRLLELQRFLLQDSITDEQREELRELYIQASNHRVEQYDRVGKTHYGYYTEPGAKEGSYREILLKLPKDKPAQITSADDPRLRVEGSVESGWEVYLDGENIQGYRAGTSEQDARDYAVAEANDILDKTPAKHLAPHYGNENENILATARINERADAEGNRVLYIEEIQSDWAQDKRKDDKPVATNPEKTLLFDKPLSEQPTFVKSAIIEKSWLGGSDIIWISPNGELHNLSEMTEQERQVTERTAKKIGGSIRSKAERLLEKNPTGAKMYNYLLQERGEGESYWASIGVEIQKQSKVADAPFIGKTEQWAGLILKRLMRYAADNGFDKIAWSTGEQQFKRWGSERVSWKKIEPTADTAKLFNGPAFRVGATEQTGGNAGGVNIEEAARTRGELLSVGGKIVESKEDLRKILRNIMRRENNEQQIDAMTDKLWDRMQKEPEGDFMPRREGMRGFYGDEQGRAPDGKPSWLANALKALPAEIRPKLESVDVDFGETKHTATVKVDGEIVSNKSGVHKAARFIYALGYNEALERVKRAFNDAVTSKQDEWQLGKVRAMYNNVRHLKGATIEVSNLGNQPGFTVDKSLANRPMPMFSRKLTGDTVQGITPSEYVKFTEAQISEQVNRAKVTVKDVAKGLLHKVTFMHDLIEIAKKEGLKSADGFNELMGQKDAIRNRIEETVDRIMQRVSNLNNKEAVESFIRDSTVGQKWGFKPSWDKEAKVDAGMKVRFDALPKESQNVVMDVFAHGENMYSQMQTLAEQEVRNEYKPLIEEANEDKKAELRKAMDKAIRRVQRAMPKLQGPYAPLKRFGDHVVVAKTAAYLTAEAEDDQKAIDALTKSTNGVHYLVEFYDNAGAAAARAKQLEADGFAKVVASNRQKQFDGIDELPWQGIQKIKHALQAEDDIKNKASMQKLVTDLYLQMLAETSARKAEMSRKGTYGSGDMFRAFAAQGRSMAHYISHMSKSGEIAKQITAMKKEAHDGGEGTRDSRTRVLNEILARFNQGLEYRETPFADKMMRATSLWMLLTSPAYYLTNATQTYMVALPVLGGRFKGAAFPAITQAYRDVARFVGKMGHELNIEDLPISKAEKEMLVTLRDNGKLDITIAADLGRWAEGSADQGKVAQALQKMNRAVAKVEALNRITTALAAYRLSGGDTKYAGKVVDETQGNYAGNNAPRFFAATGAHKVLTQFRKYQLIQLSLIGKLLHGAFKGSSKEEREVARRAFLWMFAQQIAFTGVKGAPIPAVLLMLAGALGGDDDKDWERNLRKLSDDKDVGLLLARGIPAWMGVDLSGRIGMGNAFSILPFADIPQDQSSYEKAVTAALGPTIGGIGTSVARGIDQIRHGNYYRGVEQMSPKLIKDGLAGYRTATEGITDKRGTVQMSPEDVGFFNGFMQAVGLPTTKVTEFNQLRGDLLETGKHFSDKFDALKESYAKGGDKEDIRQQWVETQEAARRWTEEMKKRGVGDKKLLEEMKPQPLSNLFKASAKKLEREREWRSVAH